MQTHRSVMSCCRTEGVNREEEKKEERAVSLTDTLAAVLIRAQRGWCPAVWLNGVICAVLRAIFLPVYYHFARASQKTDTARACLHCTLLICFWTFCARVLHVWSVGLQDAELDALGIRYQTVYRGHGGENARQRRKRRARCRWMADLMLHTER